jgi:surface polysaccharide O-acyltransferase-like enzyme
VLLSKLVNRNLDTATPNRIRQIDLLRAVSIWVVVFGHILMGVVVWQPELAITNLLAVLPSLQFLSWILQVMPVFFMAGAAANQISYSSARKKQMPYPIWVFNRFSRLLSPMFWYLLIIILLSAVIGNFLPEDDLRVFLNLATQLLWFLGIYLAMTALTPLVDWLKSRPVLVWSLLAGVAVVDLMRLQGNTPVGLLNFLAGWIFISVVGARLPAELQVRVPKNSHIGFVLLAELLLVAFLPYPLSLVGLPGEPFSNMAPPSLLLVLHGYLFYLLWLKFSSQLERLANRPRIWRFTLFTNLSAMTVYLWHLPIIMSTHLFLNLIGIEFSVSQTSNDSFEISAFYAVELFCFSALVAVLVYGFAQVAWPLEQMKVAVPKPFSNHQMRLSKALAVVGTTALSIGTLLFSVVGPAGFPNATGSFSFLSWSNGMAVALLAVGSIAIWGGAKSAPPQIS